MIAPLILLPIQFLLVFCLVKYRKTIVKRNSISVVLLFSLCIGGLILYNYIDSNSRDYYIYELNIDSEKLERLRIDFSTQYEYKEWFRPEEITEEKDILYMNKGIELENPYEKVFVDLNCYLDEKAAIEGYQHSLQYGYRRPPYRSTVQTSSDCEYAIGDTWRFQEYNGFWFGPYGDYNSDVVLRYKNIVIILYEFSSKRDSRIDEAIDMLLEDYEQYKTERQLER